MQRKWRDLRWKRKTSWHAEHKIFCTIFFPAFIPSPIFFFAILFFFTHSFHLMLMYAGFDALQIDFHGCQIVSMEYANINPTEMIFMSSCVKLWHESCYEGTYISTRKCSRYFFFLSIFPQNEKWKEKINNKSKKKRMISIFLFLFLLFLNKFLWHYKMERVNISGTQKQQQQQMKCWIISSR